MSTDNQEQSNEFPAKYEKVLKEIPEFKELVETSSIDELKALIILNESHIYETEKSLSENAKILAAKEIMKDLIYPYKESLKILNVKIKYCLYLLEQKGASQGESAVE